jgi:G3E family GTPase
VVCPSTDPRCAAQPLSYPPHSPHAVIENEFGEIDIDSELVARTEVLPDSGDAVTILSNGCLCCR